MSFIAKRVNLHCILKRCERCCRELSTRTGAQSKSFSSTSSVNSIPIKSPPRRTVPNDGLTVRDFVVQQSQAAGSFDDVISSPYPSNAATKTFYVKTYGCQMNVNDTDIVRSILFQQGYQESPSEEEADCVLTNTCAIREKAEQRVWHRLRELRATRRKKQVVGVLGCMAERLQAQLLHEGVADVAVGPDHYRDLPRLLNQLLDKTRSDRRVVQPKSDATNQEPESTTSHSRWRLETYDDIAPAHESSRISSFVSIQRGCSNHCSFCIVPYVRGPERSRPLPSVLDEVRSLIDQGVREITLLGQNVNSYHDTGSASGSSSLPMSSSSYRLSNAGFRSRLNRPDGGYWFADLLHAVSELDPEVRVRFTSPHPKDYPSALLQLMAERPNVCKHLHMPAQSGSTSVLQRMRRGYTREAYLELIDTVRGTIPDVALSTDMIAGFCEETDAEHADSASLMELVKFEQAFLFAYSRREQTQAARRLPDTVPPEVKQARLQQLIDVFQCNVQLRNEFEVGLYRLVLVEGPAKKGVGLWTGRTDQNKRVLFPNRLCWDHSQMEPLLRRIGEQPPQSLDPADHQLSSLLLETESATLQPGDYAVVQITEAKGVGLRGKLAWRSSIPEFERSRMGDRENLNQANFLQSWLSAKSVEDYLTARTA